MPILEKNSLVSRGSFVHSLYKVRAKRVFRRTASLLSEKKPHLGDLLSVTFAIWWRRLL